MIFPGRMTWMTNSAPTAVVPGRHDHKIYATLNSMVNHLSPNIRYGSTRHFPQSMLIRALTPIECSGSLGAGKVTMLLTHILAKPMNRKPAASISLIAAKTRDLEFPRPSS